MLNLSQLFHYNDSLSNEIDQILDKFDRTLESSLTGKSKSILINQPALQADSVEKRVEGQDVRIQKLHVDSAWAELNKLERRRALSQAINYARSNKSVTTSNVGTADWKWARLRRYQIEIHRKFSLSILCLIFFFIGAPLGAIIRKGGLGVPVIASVLLFLIYYIISMTGEKFVRESMLPPYVGMWISTLILVPVSIWLTSKAANDSVILNIETYFVWLKKLNHGVRKFFRLK